MPLLSGSVNYTLNATTFLEATIGYTGHSQAGCALNGAGANFCRAGFSTNPVASILNSGLGGLPFLYPDALIVPTGSYQEKALREVAPPIYDGTRILLPPPFSWGSRIANAPPNNTYPGFVDFDAVRDFATSITKVAGSHTMKGGFYHAASAASSRTAAIRSGHSISGTTRTTRSTPSSGTRTPRSASSARTRRRRSSSRATTSTTTSSGTCRTTGRSTAG